MGTKDITITKGRVEEAIEGAITRTIGPKITQQINTAVEGAKIRTGIITKFYQYLDKAEVQLDNSNQKVLCKILHRYGGELIDFFTPNGDEDFCTELHEPCIIPRGDMHCLIVNIHENDSNDWLMLGYYAPAELDGINPASQGNLKLSTDGGTNQFWIKFGYDGLDLRLPGESTTNIGNMDSEMEGLQYANSQDVYTKLEVDEKIKEITVDIELVKVVTDLPQLSDEILNHIYLLIVTGGFEVYLPYLYNGSYGWKHIGSSGGGGTVVIGTGSFFIDDNGDLYVELPEGVANPYFIDENGDLYYDTSATTGGK